jgi:hypothetical protein
MARERVVQPGPEEPKQVPDLLELAPGVRVEVPVSRQQVKLLEELDRHAGGHVRIGPRIKGERRHGPHYGADVRDGFMYVVMGAEIVIEERQRPPRRRELAGRRRPGASPY